MRRPRLCVHVAKVSSKLFQADSQLPVPQAVTHAYGSCEPNMVYVCLKMTGLASIPVYTCFIYMKRGALEYETLILGIKFYFFSPPVVSVTFMCLSHILDHFRFSFPVSGTSILHIHLNAFYLYISLSVYYGSFQ